ncbi:MAG: lipoyl synthase [Nitrospirae bacterium]|nr:lipoyl synthase [Nitrospirota bacterium]
MFDETKVLQRNRRCSPYWIKSKIRLGQIHDTKKILRKYGINTVCEEARCPNITECFTKPAATFMILGSKCTRNCSFCSIKSSPPEPPDADEPENIGKAAQEIKLRYVVITSVTRDDLPDGGAGHFAKTVSSVKNYLPGVKVEVLTPDFQGNINHLKTVLDSNPDVFNHNIETVPRLYPSIRPAADYRRSLDILKEAKKQKPHILTKSGIMLGLGETLLEVKNVLKDLRYSGCDFITIGQYMRPSKANIPVVEYIKPEVFEKLRLEAISIGFKYAASAPLVRSSMNAEEMYNN